MLDEGLALLLVEDSNEVSDDGLAGDDDPTLLALFDDELDALEVLDDELTLLALFDDELDALEVLDDELLEDEFLLLDLSPLLLLEVLLAIARS